MAVMNQDRRKHLMADKRQLLQFLEEQDRLTGFIPDAEATPRMAREMMLAEGVRPEDNAFSTEIVRSREERLEAM